MAKSDLFMGLDLSTQGLKLLVIDEGRGDIVWEDGLTFDRDLPHYNTELGVVRDLPEGTSESPPAMWGEALRLLLARIATRVDAKSIRAIAVGGQQHGLVALDEKGCLARERAKLWNDHSTSTEAEELTRRLGGRGAVIEEVANTMRPGYTAPKIYHLKLHEPEIYARSSVFLLPHNYLNYILSGCKKMEYGDASGTALWDPVTRRWSKKVVEAIGEELWEKLPEVLPPDRPIGNISTAVAERFGLNPGCLVDAGSGDNMYGAVGTGNVRLGILTLSLGTSGTAYTVLEEPFVDPEGEIACFCDSTGAYLPLVCVTNLAGVYDRVLQFYGIGREEFESLAASEWPGAGGRLILPWYEGERTPDVPWGCSVYFSFDPEDFIPEKICRSVMDGLLLNLEMGCARLPAEAKEIRLTGGLSRSPVWRQAIADIFDLPCVPAQREGVALGAAIHAAWVWHRNRGDEVELEDLCRTFVSLAEEERAKPDKRTVPRYTLLRRCFASLSLRVRGLPSPEDPFLLAEKLRKEQR